ncbi:uncharacterized protein LOC129350489 [Amphiprion ocellaris]|uniref:uncharacterized protein LOC129350489 n=1 Tax=Amphiprion ocellaris TaxID=80972 RepID=UPI0024118DA7|nr:uncharacterized protein LOC129350489 [Amphiprion ocellaris]
MTIGPPRTTTAGVGQPGGVGRGLMEAIYWHRTASNRRETQLLHYWRHSRMNPFPHAKPPPPPSCSPQLPCLLSSTSSGSSPAPASGPVPTRTPTLSTSTSSKRKRCNRKLDLPSVLVEMQAEKERNHAQHDENIWLLLSEARENEAALQREEMVQNAAFNQSFLGVLGQLVQAVLGVLGQLVQAVLGVLGQLVQAVGSQSPPPRDLRFSCI